MAQPDCTTCFSYAVAERDVLQHEVEADVSFDYCSRISEPAPLASILTVVKGGGQRPADGEAGSARLSRAGCVRGAFGFEVCLERRHEECPAFDEALKHDRFFRVETPVPENHARAGCAAIGKR